MIHKVLLVGTGLAIIFAMACEKKQEDSVPEPPQVSSEEVSSDQVRKEVGEALRITKNYVMQEKDEYAKKAKEELSELQKKVREKKPEIERMGEDAKTEALETMAQLEEKIREFGGKVEDEKKQDNGKWDEKKREMDRSLTQLRNLVGQKLGEISNAVQTDADTDATSPTLPAEAPHQPTPSGNTP